jgi:hypothetical protein
MQYAIETLEIEVGRVKGLLRQIDSNCHLAMSHIPAYDIYADNLKVLQQAIERLKIYADNLKVLQQAIERLKDIKELADTATNTQSTPIITTGCRGCINRGTVCDSCEDFSYLEVT